jgi:hypothetical protein
MQRLAPRYGLRGEVVSVCLQPFNEDRTKHSAKRHVHGVYFVLLGAGSASPREEPSLRGYAKKNKPNTVSATFPVNASQNWKSCAAPAYARTTIPISSSGCNAKTQ